MFSKTSFTCIIATFFLFVSINAEDFLVQLQTKNHQLLRLHLEGLGFDVVGYNSDTSELGVITTNPRSLEQMSVQLARNEALQFSVQSVVADQPYLQHRTEEKSFYNVQEMNSALMELQKNYPQWAKVYNLNEWLGVENTAEGRALYALQVSTAPDALEDEAKVLVIGMHHCRELMTHHAVLDGARDLLKGAKEGNSEYLACIENAAVWFVPVVNPDGLEHVMNASRMWRKNRRHNGDGSMGVDLNRNYSFQWGFCGNNSSSGYSNVYRGPSASSEPEVQVMDKLNAKLKAMYIISYHSYGDEILYAYRCGKMAEANIHYTIRDELAKELGFGKRVASSSGEDYEHHYNHHGSISYLLEIGRSFQPSFSTYQNSVWPRVQKALPFFVRQLQQPTLHLRVTDKKSSIPLEANVTIDEIQFQEGEKRVADEFGSIRWRLAPGKYKVTIDMAGYKGHKLDVVVGQKTSSHNIQLEK